MVMMMQVEIISEIPCSHVPLSLLVHACSLACGPVCAQWEACALGGALYLAAGAAAQAPAPGRVMAEAGGSGDPTSLQGTGIGCFFAPWVQALLKVGAPNWADVYHFTLGWFTMGWFERGGTS